MNKLISVIGGGISGLSFGHYCSSYGHQVKIFDAQRHRACIKSYSGVDEESVDMGAHTLYNSYGEILALLQHYKAEDLIIPRKPLKFKKYTGRREALTTGLNWAELLFHLPRLFTKKKDGLSVRDYYQSILGRKNYDRLFRFAFQAVLCQPADEYPAELLFKKRARNKRYPRSFTLQGGLETLLNILASKATIEVAGANEVRQLERGERGFTLADQNGERHQTPFLCFSCPPRTAAALLAEAEPQLARMLEEIPSVRVKSLLINTGRPSGTGRKPKNIIGIGQPFYSALSSELDGNQHWLFHFPDNGRTQEEQAKIAGEVLGLSLNSSDVRVERQTELPALKTNHLPLLREIDRYIEDKPIFIASNYMQGLSLEDCCERAHMEARRFRGMVLKR